MSNPLHRRPLALATLALLGTTAQAQEASDGTTRLDALNVVDTALKVEAPLVETPRPASVVKREELEERNVRSLDETFRYRAGVRTGHYGSDNDTDWFKIRGYDESTYQDGLRLYQTGFYQWLPETYGLERVELLKGPASILYGETPPGGVINAISKRPTETARGEVDVQAGTNNHQQLGVDTSGPVGDSRNVRYRLVGLYRSGEGDINHTENERYYVAPSLEWDLSEDTELTILASFQKDDAVPYNGFKLPFGTVQDTPFGKVDPSVNYGEPSYDTNDREQAAIGYQLSHNINDTWSFEQRVRYSQLDLLLRSTYIFFQSGPREGTRGLTYRDGDIKSWTLDNRLVGRWFTNRTENTLLLGVDYQDLKNRGQEADPFPFGAPVDLFNPQHGNFTPVQPDMLTEREIAKEQTGLYVQDQFRLDDRWIFLAGARYDQADTDNEVIGSNTVERADVEEVSWSGGLMYLADNGLSPYLSYSESFQPILGTDSNGDLYEPLKGKQYEAGIKYAPDSVDGYITVSAYKIEEENSLVTAGAVQAQAGKRTTEGGEVEGVAYLTDQLQVTGAYTYSDTTTENTATNDDEVRATLIPRHMASAWLDYSFADLVPGLKVGGGARFVGETEDVTYDLQVPSFTVFDLMARYDFANGWRAQLNASNVADREYVASCDYWCYYGAGRSVTGSLSYRW